MAAAGPSGPEVSAGRPLDYARTPGSLGPRRVRRLFLLLAGIGLALAGLKWGPPAYNRAALLYWQRQCLAHETPLGMVVHETQPPAAAALLRRSGYVQVKRSAFASDPSGHPPPAAAYIAPCWEGLCRQLDVGSGPRGATLFCHGLKSPGGNERLVYVELLDHPLATDAGDPGKRHLKVIYTVIKPATWRTPAEVIKGQSWAVATTADARGGARAVAGRVDPADGSRLVIPAVGDPGKTYALAVVARLQDDDSLDVVTDFPTWSELEPKAPVPQQGTTGDGR